MNWGWPQYVMAAIIGMKFAGHIYNALGGVDRSDRATSLIASVLYSGSIVATLYYGGFWS